MERLLEVQNLTTTFDTEYGKVTTVEDVYFHINQGETVAIVGESGSGKSVTALSIMRLLGKNGKIERGDILLNGKNLALLREKDMRSLRGQELSMVFQEPMTALNPLFTIGYQLLEVIRLHLSKKKKEATDLAIDMLEKVGIREPKRVMKQYPFALSGGMRQRIVIAMALVCQPKVFIADEPTTALDVTVQAQIMKLMKQLCADFNTAILLITHDLGVVAEMADRVVVMYAGQIVEVADVYTLFGESHHPYTKGLLESIPSMDFDDKELVSIRGSIPSHYEKLPGCRFANRCSLATERCHSQVPALIETEPNHLSRCFEWQKLKEGNSE